MREKKQFNKQKRTSGVGDGEVNSVRQDDGEALGMTTSSSDVETVGRRDRAGGKVCYCSTVAVTAPASHTHAHTHSSAVAL